MLLRVDLMLPLHCVWSGRPDQDRFHDVRSTVCMHCPGCLMLLVEVEQCIDFSTVRIITTRSVLAAAFVAFVHARSCG